MPFNTSCFSSSGISIDTNHLLLWQIVLGYIWAWPDQTPYKHQANIHILCRWKSPVFPTNVSGQSVRPNKKGADIDFFYIFWNLLCSTSPTFSAISFTRFNPKIHKFYLIIVSMCKNCNADNWDMPTWNTSDRQIKDQWI